MMNLERFKRFEKLYQVVSWIGTIGLLLIVATSHSVTSTQKPLLFLFASLFGISALLFANLLPIQGEGYVQYKPEDKVLVESLVMILLMTGFLYVMPLTSSGFFLFLIPILIEASVLHEKIILAEASFSMVSIIFLRIGTMRSGPLFEIDFIIEISVFLAVITLMYFLTRQLRVTGEKTDELSEHLSARLDQIQIISMLVKQTENFSKFDLLLEQIGEITSDAFDAEQCGFFLVDGDEHVSLHEGSVGFEGHDMDIYRVESNLDTPQIVLRDGRNLLINSQEDAKNEGITSPIGDRHLKNFMMVPLGHMEKRLGVLMIANKRGDTFTQNDLSFLMLLAEFISTLINSADAFKRIEDERSSAKKLTKLLVGRELVMKEMKKRLSERGL